MLNKRSLVEYSSSDSDSDNSQNSAQKGGQPVKVLKVAGAAKPKAKISYTALPISDPLASLKNYLEDEKKYKQL